MRFSGFGNVKLGTFKAVTTAGSSKLRPKQTLASWAVLHNPSTGTIPIQWGPNSSEYLAALDLAPGPTLGLLVIAAPLTPWLKGPAQTKAGRPRLFVTCGES